jgi:hypothetical protein
MITALMQLIKIAIYVLILLCPSTYAEERALKANVTVPELGVRQALIIANGDYQIGKLNNPVNDGRLIADALRSTGFQVTLIENAKRQTMLNTIARFGEQIEQGGTGLVYYAGHGLQVNGENWLIPVDAEIRREEDVLNYGVNLQQLLDRMQAARNPFNLVFLDACRNNPFPKANRSLTGLARVDAGLGMLIAFSTAPGQTAADGDNNSFFAAALAHHMSTPGLPIESILKRVRSDVRQISKNKQITWDNSSLEGEFYFLPDTHAQNSQIVVDEEVRLWDRIVNTPADYPLYLIRYPQGRFAELAKLRLGARQVSPEKLQLAPEKLAKATFPSYSGMVTLDDLERETELGARFELVAQRWATFIAQPLNELSRAIDDKKSSRPEKASYEETVAEALRDIKNYPLLSNVVTAEMFAFGREVPELMQKKELDAAEQRIAAAENRVAYLEQMGKIE